MMNILAREAPEVITNPIEKVTMILETPMMIIHRTVVLKVSDRYLIGDKLVTLGMILENEIRLDRMPIQGLKVQIVILHLCVKVLVRKSRTRQKMIGVLKVFGQMITLIMTKMPSLDGVTAEEILDIVLLDKVQEVMI